MEKTNFTHFFPKVQRLFWSLMLLGMFSFSGNANSLLNPGFENGFTSWNIQGNPNGFSIGTANPNSGTSHAVFQHGGGQPLLFQNIPANPGDMVTGSWEVLVNSPITGAEAVSFQLNYRGTGNAFLGQEVFTLDAATLAGGFPQGTYQTVSLSGTAPAGTVEAELFLIFLDNGPPGSGSLQIFVDDASLVSAAAVDTTPPVFATDICGGEVLVNGDFEQGGTGGGAQGWGTFGNVFTEFINVPGATAPSSQYVKLFGNFTGNFNVSGFFQSGTAPAEPGQVWNASMDMMNLSDDAMQADNFAVVKLIFLDAANNEIVSSSVESAPLNAASPQNVLIPNALTATAPADAVTVQLLGLFIQPGLGTFVGGAAFFDNASLIRPAGVVSVQAAAVGDCTANVTVPTPVATDATAVTITNSFDGDDDASGVYPIGSTVVIYTATDVAGNSSTCSQTVQVSLADAPAGTVCTCDGTGTPGGSLSCNDNVNVSVDQNCQVVITPDLILENPATGCYNVTVDGATTNIIDASNELGETFTIMITAEDGNSCWGTITVEDKAAPTIECTDLNIECTDAVPGSGGGITATDNCSNPATISMIDQSTNDDDNCTIGTIITREYIAIDAIGNISDPCTQTITITRVTDVDFPADIAWSCNQYASFSNITAATALLPMGPGQCIASDATVVNDDNDAIANTLDGTDITRTQCLSSTGSGVPSVAEGTYCNFAATSSDEILELCGNDATDNLFKIVRTWTVLDWCTNSLVTTGASGEDNIQVIKIVDITAPVITVDATTVSANVPGEHPQPCRSTALLPVPTLTDNCDNAVTYEVFTPVGPAVILNGAPRIPDAGLPIGDHNVTYVATDICGNTSELTIVVKVVDDITPTPVCDEITQVALSTDGTATVSAETFDDGSNDNCGVDHFEVRRMTDNCGRSGNLTFDNSDDADADTAVEPGDASAGSSSDTDEGAYVTFCCADINTTVMVVFRVYDYYGNYNDCMVEVLVEDKLAPFKVSDVADGFQVACDNYFNNFAPALDIALANGDTNPQVLIDAFGDVSYDDNCGANVTTSWSRSVNTCGIGTITRNWTVSDDSGNIGQSCSQSIQVYHVNDWSIQFPADVNLVCVPGQEEAAEGGDFGEPTVFDDDCELVAISSEDATYNIVPDACYKIIRTYTAINWCIYDGTASTAVNNNNPTGTGNDDRLRGTRRYEEGGADSGSPSSQTYNDTDVFNFADDDLNFDDGIVVYIQTIKVQDNVAPVITAGDQDFCIDGATDADGDCDRNITLEEAVVTDCSEDVTVTYTVTGLGTGRTFNDVAPGTYAVTVTAIDNCGNQSLATYNVTVRDCKLPTPYCVGGLVVELMPIDNDGDGFPDAGMVELWATDFDAGSFDNCTLQGNLVFTASQEDDGVASSTANISFDCNDVGPNGVYVYVTDEAGNTDYCLSNVFIESVPNVCPGPLTDDPVIAGTLTTENNAPLAGASVSLNNGAITTTDVEGAYDLTATEGEDVTVTPEYNVYDNTSVTTFDLLLIRKHILTTELLDSPYKMIAADINNSQSITASDLVAARQVILGMTTSYANNNAWAFVDADYTFPADWSLTDSYPAVTNVNNIDADETANFVAIRVGDVNGTYGFADSADERNSMIINANDATLVAGQEVTVEFSAADAVLGYQFTLNFDNLEVVSIDGNEANFGVFANAITTSFDEKASDRLFSVTFRATADVVVSEAVALTSNITTAEAYGANGAMNIALEFANTTADFALYQNTPNPVKDITTVSFNLPTANAATVTVSDITGKVVSVINGDYAKGYNQVTLSNLPAGVLTYTLSSADFSATKTMVVVK